MLQVITLTHCQGDALKRNLSLWKSHGLDGFNL